MKTTVKTERREVRVRVFLPEPCKNRVGYVGKTAVFFLTTVPRPGIAVFTQFREVSQQRTVVQNKVPAEDRGSGK